MSNKKAQVSETMVWIIATVIVIFGLIIFVTISTQFAKVKTLDVGSIFEGELDSLDRLPSKTNFALSINEENKEVIKEWIENE